MSLRADLKKLAAERPELRKHLVPLLRRHKRSSSFPQPVTEAALVLAASAGKKGEWFDLKEVAWEFLDEATDAATHMGHSVFPEKAVKGALKTKPRIGPKETYRNSTKWDSDFESETHVSFEVQFPEMLTFRFKIKGNDQSVLRRVMSGDYGTSIREYKLEPKAVMAFFKDSKVKKYLQRVFSESALEGAADMDGWELEGQAEEAAYDNSESDTTATKYTDEGEEELYVVPELQYTLDTRAKDIKAQVKGFEVTYEFPFSVSLGRWALPGDHDFDSLHG